MLLLVVSSLDDRMHMYIYRIYIYMYMCIYIYRVGYMAKWLGSSTQNHRPNPHLDHLTLGRKACPICLRGPQRHPRRLYLGEVKSNQHPQRILDFCWFIYHAFMDCLRLDSVDILQSLDVLSKYLDTDCTESATNSWEIFVSVFPCTMGIAA